MTMQAMVLEQPGEPLRLQVVKRPVPREGQVLIKVRTCAVCRTDLHIVDGELTRPKLPLILGHEVIGEVVSTGGQANDLKVGERVGVPWLGGTCGQCHFCQIGKENLCDRPTFTGYTHDGGFAEYIVANAAYVFPIPFGFNDVAAAPLMCAGLIGYRAYAMVGDARRIGLYGFGSAAHIMAQIARHQGRDLYAFTRSDDRKGQDFARSLGAIWAGGSDQPPPETLDAAIIFAPVGGLIPTALSAVAKGGKVICAGIHMSNIPSFPYELLWGERQVCSVANLTRRDGIDFLNIAPKVPVRTTNHVYALQDANHALDDLRAGRFEGAAVLCMP